MLQIIFKTTYNPPPHFSLAALYPHRFKAYYFGYYRLLIMQSDTLSTKLLCNECVLHVLKHGDNNKLYQK